MDPSDAPHASSLPRGVRLGVGAAIVAVIVIAAVVIGAAVWRGATAPVEVLPPAGEQGAAAGAGPEPGESAGPEPAEVYVHVSGAVAAPGLYALGSGARVMDAVAAAGGLTDEASAEAVNLARPVVDGEQIAVPTREQVASGEAPAQAGSSGPAGQSGSGGPGGPAGAVIDLNTADAAQLETLPGIGPALAGRIVSWREENGRFSSVDDLLAVSGIGEKVLAGLRESVTV